MKAEQTKLEGCFIIHDSIFRDSRGYFFESFNQQKFAEQTGQVVNFVQDNQSYSSRGVLRGLHLQKGEAAQAKLVRVITGKVLDIAVDVRKGSPTFGQHVAVELTEENHTQLFIPRGFAHGFIVLSETATFFYKCDNFYNKAAEGGIIYNDPDIAIDWQIPSAEFELSEKDLQLPGLQEFTAAL
ncbi:dTDP-4-dehydrorhamnose 3,5-epimerase [Filimonas zeae]|uniref:dTDP-4-dehydrorhamnose 3,5-epimerase n=1 Tax=Filimonas zeae TaxID=1737353 RepID=A0A917ILW4_9BACT|nr:dTDP-4-dehydrorhamnose 3,5-epimerase [Filimonas zeae]MDR6337009.1 dTDP-4-dehydrorhamnose 3,5-epimerase [Filimonas zeae]GGH56567.1 dTDP-4-dehydrorhamnose 3,5-epimerase [Filimonas zeae]